MSKLIPYICVLLLFPSCANVDISACKGYRYHENFFKKNQKLNLTEHEEILISETGDYGIFKKFRITFKEHYVINNNLLEITESNALEANQQVPYIDLKGYYQQLFLIKIDNKAADKFPYFLYTSLKFKAGDIPIAMGKTFVGRMEIVRSESKSKSIYRLAFNEELKYKKAKENPHEGKYVFEKVKAPMIFYIDMADYTDESIRVSTIILNGPNSIGGTKHLTYNVEETFGSKEALKFTLEK